jgi:hypothetical protein
MKYSKDYVLKLNFKDKCVKSLSQTKLLGLNIDNSLSWNAHINHIISKLNTAYFSYLTIQPTISTEIQL